MDVAEVIGYLRVGLDSGRQAQPRPQQRGCTPTVSPIRRSRKVATRDHNGIRLSVYYHPGHDWNVAKMLNAMGAALDYYRAHYGPYQFNYARIVEFPGYASYAQAFAGTMPYSESIGFNADTNDPTKIDFTTYVVAHEMSHQYWAHQVIGADMQGGTLSSETLAQYSAPGGASRARPICVRST